VFTTATKDQVIAILVRALSPYVGATMASASVRGLCDRLVFGRSQLGRAQVETLIESLAPGLHVFVGKEKTRVVVSEIWSAIEELGGDS
jgi:hypothetical protein